MLSEHPESEVMNETAHSPLPELAMPSAGSRVWLTGTGIMWLILLFQIVFFEGDHLSRSPQLRRGLEALCALVSCQLPVYRNLDELAVSNASLQPRDNRSYQFVAALSNQGPFPQRAPKLKITLLGFNGQALAERVFAVDDYLVGPELPVAEQTAQIRLQLAAPLASVGGYTFTLI